MLTSILQTYCEAVWSGEDDPSTTQEQVSSLLHNGAIPTKQDIQLCQRAFDYHLLNEMLKYYNGEKLPFSPDPNYIEVVVGHNLLHIDTLTLYESHHPVLPVEHQILRYCTLVQEYARGYENGILYSIKLLQRHGELPASLDRIKSVLQDMSETVVQRLDRVWKWYLSLKE